MRKSAWLVPAFVIAGLFIGTALSSAQCVATLVDETCSAATTQCTLGSANCSTTSFSVPTTGSYCLGVMHKCNNANCHHGISCAGVLEGGDYVMKAYLDTECSDCVKNDCTGPTTATLVSGHFYTLEVCLNNCPFNDCEDCPDATAEAIVYRTGTRCDF